MKRPPNQQPVPTVAIALMTAFVLIGGFVALVAVVIPGAFLMLAAMMGLGGFFVAQYFVWGKWLYRYVVEKERQREADGAAVADSSNLP